MNPEEYRRHYDFEEDYWWFIGRRKIIFDQIARLPLHPEKSLILDAGCGTGFITKLLSTYGKTFGIEVSEEGLLFCKSRNLKNLVRGNIQNSPFTAHRFDLITLLDLLEHLDEDVQVLREMYRICKEGGYLLIFVPAYAFLWSGEDVVSQHRRRYTAKELLNKVQESGFLVKKLSYVNTFLFPVIFSLITFNKFFRPDTLFKSNLKPLPIFLNKILAQILKSESFFLRKINFPFGTSLLCLAVKSGPNRRFKEENHI
jgi:SAM-dependent methyltransferase